MDRNRERSLEEIDEYHFVTSQIFRSENEAYTFFNSYARDMGFSIRKGKVRRRRSTREITWRRFFCSCEGYRDIKHFERDDRQREPRPLTRCGCSAYLDVKLSKKGDIWFVDDYEDTHDHPLANSEHVFVLRSHRRMNEAQKAEAVALSLGGLRPCQIMDVMQKSHGGPGDTGFLLQDLYNFFAREKKEKVEGSDAQYVLNYMAARKDENPEFYFEFTKDDEGRLQNMFWSDSQSQLDFSVFGDVVVFDSTYRVNRYNLPFVPFIGVGNHRTTVVFGCGILSDETITSYVWLLRVFLKAMRQRHPRSLITDGDTAMAKAIEIVMPDADHRLCSWHIEQNMVKRLRGKKLRQFRSLIYKNMDVVVFEKKWVKYKADHKITDRDVWALKMYDLRYKWAAAFTKGRHFLGMQSNQRSESLNSRLHTHLDRTMSLIDLVEHYEFCLLSIRRREVELDAISYNTLKFTEISADPYEKSAARIFTPAMFTKVREQVRRLCKWEVTEATLNDGCMRYEVTSKVKNQLRVHVDCTFEGGLMVNAACQCRMMESEDIPCGHIFCVMRFIRMDNIPSCCISARWTKDAKKVFPTELGTNTQVWSEQMDRFHALRNKANCAMFKASKSAAVTDCVMEFLDGILAQDNGEDDNAGSTSFGPVPAHFSSARQPYTSHILDPKKKISKGAPSLNRRWRSSSELWRTN